MNEVEETTGRAALAEMLTRGVAQADTDASALEQTRLAAKVSITACHSMWRR